MKQIAPLFILAFLAACIDSGSDNAASSRSPDQKVELRGSPNATRNFTMVMAPSGKTVPVGFDIKRAGETWQVHYFDLKDETSTLKIIGGTCLAREEDEIARIFSELACKSRSSYDIFRFSSSYKDARNIAKKRLKLSQPRNASERPAS